MVPMHGNNDEGIFYEPTVWCPSFSRSGPPEGGTPNKFRPTVRFMASRHPKQTKGTAVTLANLRQIRLEEKVRLLLAIWKCSRSIRRRRVHRLASTPSG